MCNVVILSESALFRFSLDLIINTDNGVKIRDRDVSIVECSSLDNFIHSFALSEINIVILDTDGVPKEKQNIIFKKIRRTQGNILLLIFSRHEPDSNYYRSLSQVTRFIVSKKEPIDKIILMFNNLLLLTKNKSRASELGQGRKLEFELSPKEQEVMYLASLGLDYSDISQKMGVTRKTVSHYICRIRDKCQYKNSIDIFLQHNVI
ncbi:sigma factor-like helix-turn-helix DNA-binding protein [Yersinia frederiksenii]|uniref:sigma factor-like helix-turn-helix DNA-binding protein n=1 Tax=Yersinia frederiksenii TaxID=29484 RepID=UPI0005E6B6FB|nr:sigma factor-like helix-turn-helix DNA-binding protein [Yersinia frederiksenii]CQJ05539.1 DNA-binding transcriptional activator EvgA [Yersinia frederiksenii]